MSTKKPQQQIIRKCILIGQSLSSTYIKSNIFIKINHLQIIHYTLKWLIINNIEQVIIYCSQNKQLLQQFLKNYQSQFKFNKLKIHFIKNNQLLNIGDVLRQINFNKIVTQDFLLLFADSILNINLYKISLDHFKKKKQLKNVVLTTIMMQNSSQSKLIHILNQSTNQILQIEDYNTKTLSIACDKINLKKINVTLRTDLRPCEVYIVSCDVPKSFKEIYQMTSIYEFIHNMLTSEVYEEKINAYILPQGQLCYRTNTPHTYYLAYINYICGHLHPFTPMLQHNPKISIMDYNRIISNSAIIDLRKVHLTNNIYIGQNTKIQQGCKIQRSIIMNDSIIHKNVILKNCIVLPKSIISPQYKYCSCLIETQNSTISIHPFDLRPSIPYLIQKNIIEEQQNHQQLNLQQTLKDIIYDQPDRLLLFKIAKTHNVQIKELLKQIIKILAPKKLQGLQNMLDKWGNTFRELHDSDIQLLTSLQYTCRNLSDYHKAYHIFIQLLIGNELIQSQNLLKYFNQKGDYSQDQILQKSQAFISQLQQENQENEQKQDN